MDNTRGKIFGIIFGVLAPPICLYFDPVLFTPHVPAPIGGMLPLWLRTPIYILSILCVLVYLFVLAKLPRPKWTNWLFAWVLLYGMMVAIVIGIVLLPLSILGIFLFGAGLLGLIPFITATCYWIAYRKVERIVCTGERRRHMIMHVTPSCMLFVISVFICLFWNWRIEVELKNVMVSPQGKRMTVMSNYAKLSGGDFERLFMKVGGLPDNDPRRQEIAQIYEELTGRNFEEDIKWFSDFDRD